MAMAMDELDPELILDMPVQQSNDMFGLSLGDEFGFNHEGLSVSDLGTGFGNVQAADVSGNLSFPTTHAPFSLADELAGALSGGVNHEDDATTLLAELDLDSGHHERLPSLQSSPMRTAKSSRMTVTSQRTDNETDEFTSNIDFENVTDTLQVMVHDLRQITETLRTCNIPSTSTSHDTEQRIESLCSTLIKGIYETLKQHDEHQRDLHIIEQELRSSSGWLVMPPSANSDMAETEMELSTVAEEEAEQLSLNGASVGTVNDYGVAQMSLVRNVTDEVIGSLSAISEQLQVSKVAGSDIWRKLRATESGLSRLKTESESVQLSQERIESWESKHGLKESAIPGLSSPSATAHATSSHSAFGKQAQKHYASTCDLLEKASAQAQRLLVNP